MLTGTIENYSCEAVDRSSSTFSTEYALTAGQAPYDFRYSLPYHRPLSGGCAPSPGSPLTGNPFIYPATNAIGFHYYSNNTSCSFNQPSNDGILDVFSQQVRFALMTFDTAVSKETGFSPSNSMTTAIVDNAGGRAGLWSYIVNNSPATGRPRGCATSSDQEVGARNAAAPPWEGRMVNFGNPNDGVGAYSIKNSHIQDVLLGTRPYGATPIAGMLQDAEDFFVNDKSTDPDRNPSSLLVSDPAADFGPWQDPFLSCGRTQSIILLTDGQPNMDLRPYCEPGVETPAGKCPFLTPEEIAGDLYTNHEITTHVVGFALDSVDEDNNPGTPNVTCSSLAASATPISTYCTPALLANNLPLQACCSLVQIAVAGGGQALFASNKLQLRSQISALLSSSVPSTSRTQPVVAGGGSGGSFRFFTSFQPGTLTAWSGILERERFSCSDPSHMGVPWPQVLDTSKGDDFVHNVNKAGPAQRLLYTYVGGATSSDPVLSAESMRPGIGSTDPDGVGTYVGRVQAGTSANFVAALPPAALAVPTASCVTLGGVSLTASQCRDQYLEWVLGLSGPSGSHRCPGAGTCDLIGDIYHSTPQVLGKAASALRDESYARYALLQATRPTVLYTSTNDGMLHAFRVTSNDPADFSDDDLMVRNDAASNELWALFPPAVLPNLYHLYPYNHQLLLDGIPTISEVVAVEPALANTLPTVFERSATDAQSGAGTWRAVLAQSFGGEHSGYFAVDVTDPVPDAANPTDLTKGGPRLLWQLTHDKNGDPLFGRGGSTPTITTLFFDPSGGNAPREIPVAVLPGGPGGTRVTSGSGCPATPRTYTSSNIDAAFPPRGRVHCYDYGSGNNEIGARSLTIVRLDTGEIIRTFRQDQNEVLAELRSRVTEVDLDAPITGRPVAFPALVGTVADRVYVGDAEGRLWKVNLSARKPADWTMELFFDLYPANFGSAAGHDFSEGQPLDLPPALSVNEFGNLTLNVASGSQGQLGPSPNTQNYVYALKDAGGATEVAWYQPLDNGERVLGPMVVFNRALYFATFLPEAGTSTCKSGTSRVWGMNYIEPEDTANLDLGGSAVADFPNASTPYKDAQTILGGSNTDTVIYGVSLVQQPSCYTEIADSLGDDVLGFRGQHQISQLSSGGFQLVMHTGSGTSSTSVSGAQTNSAVIDLAQPPALSYTSAWASIDE